MGVDHKAELGQVLKKFWDHSSSPVCRKSPLSCCASHWLWYVPHRPVKVSWAQNEWTYKNQKLWKNSLFMCHWALRPGSTGSTSRHSVCKNEGYNVSPSHWEVCKYRRKVHVQVYIHFLTKKNSQSVKDSVESRAILPYYTLLLVLTSYSPPWPV